MLFSDLRTVVAITSLMGCLMSIVLYALRRTYPKSIKGLGKWAAFPALGFFSSVLYGMQGSWHHLASMALPNFLLVISLVSIVVGTYEYFDVNLNRSLIYFILGGSLVFNLWTSGKDEYYVHRLIFINALTVFLLVFQLKLLWQHRRGSFGVSLMICTTVVLCLVMLGRFVSAIIDPPPAGIYTFTPLQAVYLVSYSFGILLLSVCVVLLSFERLRNDLEMLLKYDGLTGALTRRAAFEYGNDLVAHSVRHNSTFSVLMMDVDHFKLINDKYGHQVGDGVLTAFVKRVESVLRRPAGVGRYGEEFVAFLPDTSEEQGVKVAQRIQESLRLNTDDVRFTASIGVADFSKSEGDSLDAVIDRADAAMYVAKQNGRNRVVAYSAHSDQKMNLASV